MSNLALFIILAIIGLIAIIALVISILTIKKLASGFSLMDINEFKDLPSDIRDYYNNKIVTLYQDLSRNINPQGREGVKSLLSLPVCLLAKSKGDSDPDFTKKYESDINDVCESNSWKCDTDAGQCRLGGDEKIVSCFNCKKA